MDFVAFNFIMVKLRDSCLSSSTIEFGWLLFRELRHGQIDDDFYFTRLLWVLF